MGEKLLSVESVQSRSEIAETLRSIADQFDDDILHVTVDHQATSLGLTDSLSFEMEIERESDEIEFEIEIEWVEPVETEGRVDEIPETEGASEAVSDDTQTIRADEFHQPNPIESLGEFQLFQDRADEWRWRLLHQNGNIIATSGEGYTTKQNAEKGIRSVLRNAPGADVTETD